ncbi:hypothetical protein KR018_011398, partial [Drosophila ironensis]
NGYYLEKENSLLEILHQVHEPLLNDQWRLQGEQLVTDKGQYVTYNNYMQEFHECFKLGKLLGKKEYYNPLFPEHYRQTLGLYHFFYNAMDWYTLWQNICWARVHMNPGLFVQALTQVLLKRDDYQALVMPKVYEIWPESYHDLRTVKQSRHLNFANWIRRGNMSDLEDIHPQEMEPRNLEGNLRNSSEWFQAMADVNILRLHQKPKQGGNKLDYLLEDVGWLSHWYYLNLGVNFAEEKSDQLQEWWYYKLDQILARYKLERYGQKMSYKKLSQSQQQTHPIRITWQNLRFQEELPETTRKINEYLQNLETKVSDAIATKSLILNSGTFIDLKNNDNWLMGLHEIFPYDWTHLQLDTANEPQLLLDMRTTLMSENFYYYADRLLQSYRWYRTAFQPPNPRSFIPSNLRIESVEISPLITFDQEVDIDLSNLMHAKHFHLAGHFMWPFTLQQRQLRLQQKDFSYTLEVSSNKTQSVVFRTFLTTSEGQSINREPFYQLDSFLTVIYEGVNQFRRESSNFSGLVGDHISLTELKQFVELAQREEFDFPLNISTPNCGFPRRLILPRGGRGNPLKMRLLILATTYDFKARQGNELSCDFSKGISRWDELPLGYPFERFLEEDSLAGEVYGDHVIWKEVEIWHDH